MANMRPFQIVILAVFGLAAILGLALFASFQGFGRNASEVGAVTIWGLLPESAFDPALTELKQVHKEYGKVTYTAFEAATFDTQLANALASGTGPDLILINQEHLLTERSRLSVIPYSSITERAFRDSYLPIFDTYLSTEGTYGIPLLVDPLVLYYNPTALSAAGVVQPPSTWEAVTGLTPTLTRITNAQAISRSAIALGTYENVAHARAILSLLFFQAGQPIIEKTQLGLRSTLGESGGDTFGSSAAESALNFYTEFANPTKTIYTWNRSLPDSRQAFTRGDSVFYLGYASERAGIAAANPNLPFDMAMVPQPATASAKTTYGKAYAFALPKASKNASGAYEVAFAMTAKDILPALARGAGMAPGVRSFLTPSTEDLYEPVYYPQALVARAWLSPAPASLDAVFAAMIGNVTSGRMNVKQALDSADQALNAALSQ